MMNRLNARSVWGILFLLMLVILSSFSQITFGATEQVRVSFDNDDAEERISDGDMDRSSSDLELGYDSALQIVGMRFRTVNIPQGATINSAYIEFETDETDSGSTNLVIYGEATDSSTIFANNDGNISDRSKTAASVTWSPSIWNSVNGLHQTPDLAAIIQEIVNRPLWLPNNHLTIIIEPGAGCTTSACRRTAESHDGESGAAPLLVVEYNVVVPPEISSVNGSCSALQTVTVVYSEDVEESSAELVGNYQLTNPAGTVIALNSATLTASNTVTLSASTLLNDLTEYTITINNVEDLTGTAIAAGSSSSFMLSCNLNCISDTFAGPGALSSDWSSGSSSGSFGNPRIVTNGRLRLTDATGNVATVATLLNRFPGADNRIEIEFDYYAYNGSGADGIAVTFSDADIAPSPGGYGGSLGYAQRNPGIAGFTGGWLGIGIDEYGNFANPTEERQGGSGFAQDSVALRGSGSGSTGYPFLTGTGTLSPGVDQSGATPGPGHRYKIIIDHTMGGSVAYVSVARDTGSGYVDIVPAFDIFSVNPAQAAVPTDWVVSFTGSTGGSTNIHEIGNFGVCAAQPIGELNLIDHYEISHSSPGVTCEGSQITVTAHDASHNPVNVSSNINLTVTTSPSVTSIISSPATITAGSSSTTFYLNQSSAQAGIDIDVTDGTATDLDDGSAEDPPLDFLATAFLFSPSIGSQVAGKSSSTAPGAQALTLRAVRTSTETGACEAALTGTQAVNLAYECNNPGTCTTSDLLSVTAAETKAVSRNNNGASLNYTSVNMTFDATGSAPLSFIFSDAGELTLHAHKSVLASSPEPAFALNGSSNPFWSRPDKLVITAKSAAVDLNGATSSASPVHKSGAIFDLVVTSLNTSGVVTQNYQPGQIQFLLNRTGPSAGGSDGILLYAAGNSLPSSTSPVYTDVTLESFVSGVSTFSSANYSEVGLLNLDLQDANYGAAGVTVPGDAIAIGRFIPDHFDIQIAATDFDPSCGGFTYIGQQFFYKTAPSVTVTARNSAGGVTENYEDSYWKLGTDLSVSTDSCVADSGFCYSDNVSNGVNVLSAPPTAQSFGDTSNTDGSLTFDLHSGQYFVYSKSATSMGPFDADVGLKIYLSDDDNVSGSATIDRIGFDALHESDDPALIALNTTNDSLLRYGRWNMENVFGPETSNLAMDVYTEYLDATGSYRVNSADSCTNLSGIVGTPLAGIVIAPTGTAGAGSISGITVGSGTTDLSFDTTLSGGEGQFTFTAPGSEKTGAVDVDVDLSALPWLQFDWDSDGTLGNHPGSRATFGQYRGNDRIIYWREVEN